MTHQECTFWPRLPTVYKLIYIILAQTSSYNRGYCFLKFALFDFYAIKDHKRCTNRIITRALIGFNALANCRTKYKTLQKMEDL